MRYDDEDDTEYLDRNDYLDQLDNERFEGLTIDEIADLQNQEAFRRAEYAMFASSWYE